MAKSKKATKQPKPILAAFTFTVKLGNKTYEGQGATAAEAIQNTPKPEKMMLSAIVTLSTGLAKFEQRVWPARLKRMFYNKTAQAIQAKQFASAMKPIKHA